MLTPPPLSLYIHIPWCIQKCPYCDFNSHALKGKIPESEYIDALIDDLDTDLVQYKMHNDSRKLHSIFIGGGTPSLISASQIERLLSEMQKRLPFADDIEITMEANPGTLEANRFVDYRRAGVNRISIGVQSFQQQKLKKLGRIHNHNEAIRAAQFALDAKLNSFNLDLMHGLPDQTMDDALSDLQQAIRLNPPHISWYQLTIEPNTAFHYKPPTLPNDDALWSIFEQGDKLLTEAGYVQYETSGYSKEGYQCRHNLNYWRFGDYLGIGCGAHGKLSFSDGTIIRTTKIKHPKGFLDHDRPYLMTQEKVLDHDRPFEFFMNRFRLLEPCLKKDFIDRTGLPLTIIRPTIDWAIDKKYIEETEQYWQITQHGKLFLNDLLTAFLP